MRQVGDSACCSGALRQSARVVEIHANCLSAFTRHGVPRIECERAPECFARAGIIPTLQARSAKFGVGLWLSRIELDGFIHHSFDVIKAFQL